MIESDDEIIRGNTDKDDLTTLSKIISRMPKENLKSILYLLAGRQDSNVKMFYKRLFIKPEDIYELNISVQEKLEQHITSAAIVSVDIMYRNGRAIQFGTWDEFQSHNWRYSDITEKITIKWDFIIKLPNYLIPQRHTLTVTLLGNFSPLHMLQAIFSADPSNLTEAEMDAAPVICRVDFISFLLSDELINITERWVESRETITLYKPLVNWLKKNRRSIASIIQTSVPLFISILCLAFYYKYTNTFNLNSTATVGMIKNSMCWLLYSSLLILSTFFVGKYLGQKIYVALHDSELYSVFGFTNGDKNEIKRVEEKNKKELRSFFINVAISFIIDIVAAGFSCYLFRS